MDILAGVVQEGHTTAKTYAGVYVGGSDATGRYAIRNEPEGEVVALSGPDDECPYYKRVLARHRRSWSCHWPAIWCFDWPISRQLVQ